MNLRFNDLVDFVSAMFRAAGVKPDQARITAVRLIEADARGRDGHGLIRVVPYLDRIAAGGINLDPRIRVLSETDVSAQIDADNGLGQVAMTRAVEVAGDKATRSGVAVVGTVHSNHAGAAGLYPAMLAERDLVGIYFAVANANGMPPWGGTDPILGTNPLACAVPQADGPPFLLDVASTTTSHGAIKVVAARGGELPAGWVVDRSGEPITDPGRADEGFLVPIGGHKGSGLTMMIGLLAGVLNGAAFGREVVDQRLDLETPTNTGQLLIAFRADLFRPIVDVLPDVTRHLEELRGAGDGVAVRLPGDVSATAYELRHGPGVAVAESVVAALDRRAVALGVGETLRDKSVGRRRSE